MMLLFVGLGNLAIGLAYAGLGTLSAWESISLHRYRGWSRFGVGFALMAASCGPHHLVHGWHVLQGESVSWPMVAATLTGLPAGLIFVWLRFETMWGGQGERSIAFSPHRAVLLAGVFAAAAGWLAACAFARPEADISFQTLCTPAGLVAPASIGFFANMFVAVAYGMVGWYLADHQVHRHLTSGAWSLSGVALSAIFFTCAQMHVIDATAGGDGLMLVFDLLGIPASIYFLWVVKQVHRDFVSDWNRRPLIGAAAAPPRPSPWSGESPQH